MRPPARSSNQYMHELPMASESKHRGTRRSLPLTLRSFFYDLRDSSVMNYKGGEAVYCWQLHNEMHLVNLNVLLLLFRPYFSFSSLLLSFLLFLLCILPPSPFLLFVVFLFPVPS